MYEEWGRVENQATRRSFSIAGRPETAIPDDTERALRGQSAAGPADGEVCRFVGRGPGRVWWARTIVESSETAQLMSSLVSA